MSEKMILPPGPGGWLGVRTFGEMRRDPLGFLTGVVERYGDISSFGAFGRRYVVVGHPDLAKEILLTQADAFWKGRALQNSKGLLGEGLLTAEGEVHKCQRRVMQPAFHAKRVEAYGPAIVEATRAVGEAWGKRSGEVVDVRAAMMGLTLGIAGETLFGAMLAEETAMVGRSMEVMMNNYGRTVVPWGKVLNALPLPSTIRLARARRNLMGLVDRIIAARREEMARGDAGNGDLLSALLAATDPERGGTRLTDQQVQDQAITILTAGHETTANALTFMLWLLARHPGEQAKLREEILREVGEREVTVEDLGRLERVRWVVSESMRLLPPAWTLGRENQREVEIGGYVIPAKSTFLIPQWVMHRDGRFFAEPLAFLPERWREPRHPRYAYLPFSTGPRNCIGESFAWLEMMLVVAGLVGRFGFEGAGEMGLVPAITLRPREEVMVRVNEVKRAGATKRTSDEY